MFKDSCVVMVDMQTRFLESFEKHILNELIENQKKLLLFCSKYNIPLIVLEYYHLGKTIKKIEKNFSKISSVKIFEKFTDDGCLLSPIDDKKRIITISEVFFSSLGKKTVIFAGVNKSVCVQQVAKRMLQDGHTIATSLDIIADDKWVMKHLSDGYGLAEKEEIKNFWAKNGILTNHVSDLIEIITN